MAGKMSCIQVLIILLFLPIVRCDDATIIPSDKSKLNTWFDQNIRPVSTRKGSIDPALAAAESGDKVVKVRTDGSGDFKTVNDAIKSIPVGNQNRVIVWIGPGNYTEKIRIERDKPFITFYGESNNMPTLVYDGTAAEYGTVDSATFIVESDYFSAVNLKIVNSAPRPDGKRKGAQASALRIGGDKASFYNCKLYGFQDTLCDHRGKHFFKDCYIEGTVDFIFGSGKSLYLNTETHVLSGDSMAMITAQARSSDLEDTGYSFVHCKVTGTGKHAYLGRSWKPSPRVVFAYSELSDAVNPVGWSDNFQPQNDKTAYFGEYQNTGPGSNTDQRVGFTKKLTPSDAEKFISLDFIEGSKWILPPTKL